LNRGPAVSTENRNQLTASGFWQTPWFTPFRPPVAMKFRDQILSHLRKPGYRPATAAVLGRTLQPDKRQRRQFEHELRLLLSRGELALVRGDKVALPQGGDEKPTGKGATKGAHRPGSGEVVGKLQFRTGGSAFVIPEADPKGPRPEAVQVSSEDTGLGFHGDKVRIQLDSRPGRSPRRHGGAPEPRGRVVEIIERGRTEVVGALRRIRTRYYVQPDDPRFVHEIAVDDPAHSALKPPPDIGDKVVVKLEDWTSRARPPEGRVIERLGKTWEPRAELLGVYRKFDLDPRFPADVEKEVRGLPHHVQEHDLKGRMDYREVPTFTIDPDDAKDFDDALSLETLPDGTVKVGIHIADVSAYVKPGTALDREAQKRGNSTYLVGTVIPMLPEKLSNGLCSLVEREDRLTKAVFLTFDRKGKIQATAYANTVIRSQKRLTYKQAYALLKQNDLAAIRALPLPPKHQTGSTGRALSTLTDLELLDLQSWVRKLWALASQLRRDRMHHGSLDLDMPETKIFVDEEGYADRLEKIEHDESHQLIEEFMLAANEAVARITRQHRLPSLYRVHDDPDPEKLNELREHLATFGIRTGDLTVRAEVVKLLQTLSTHPQGYTLRTMLLRSLKKAAYRHTPDGHYGLHKRDYTHFTSPIRRYSDLVVHRVFDHYLITHAGWPTPANYRFVYNANRTSSLGEHLSLTEINSTDAERESVKIKLLEYFERELAKKRKQTFVAIITDVRPAGLFIELEESMTFGFLPASSLPSDYYSPTDDGTALVGRRTKRHYRLNDRLSVVVAKVDRVKRMIDFEAVE
jgi:ribonuclease R